MKAALKYFFLYVILFVVGFAFLLGVYRLASYCIPGYTFSYDDMFGDSWQSSISIMLASQLLPIYVFLKRKYTSYSCSLDNRFGKDFSKEKLYLWTAVAGIGCWLFDVMLIMMFPVIDEWNISLFGDFNANSDFNFIDLISGCLLAPLVEEAIFRGAIERRLLETKWNPWFAIVISALLFAIPHFSLYAVFSCFGILVGWLYYRTRSIWPGILVHFLFNTISFVPFYISEFISSETSTDEEASLSLGISIPLFILGIVILFFSVKQIAYLTKERTPISDEQVSDIELSN